MSLLRLRPLVGTRNPIATARPTGLPLTWELPPPATALPGAACAGMDPDLFFPEEGDEFAERRAKQACQGCPVRELCLALALKRREPHGIFGGLDTQQRRRVLYGKTSLRQAMAESGGAA
ncbi:hypothetical protein P3T37_002239 [Kitasatospora sp. MAA4]|uniref:WhiB family transcriptional regulator n=1 Tax=Kitasatospora sp. MAA4 TaxID=3035093 RepID=UPI002474AFEE|nr:WhiB family transcriptional regulator [Kitasatospora sp. MAA4]MDH6132853.1 hypothetical protein [Kitasatospora sp. MAA4]